MEEPKFSSFFFRQRLNAVGIPFLAGVLIFVIAPGPLGLAGVIVFALFFLGMAFVWKGSEGRATLLCAAIGLAFCLILSGMTLIQESCARSLLGKQVSVKGTVTAVDNEGFDLSLCSLEDRPFFWNIRCEGGERPTVGDRLSGSFLVFRASSRAEEKKEIDLFGTFAETPTKTGTNFLFSSADSIRSTLIRRFGASREAGFLRAALLGDRSALSSRDKDAFSRTGSSHLLAISGLHLTQMMGFFIFGFRFLPLSRRQRQWLLFPLVLFLFLLTGASVSVFRAGFMFCFSMSASLFRRRSDSVTALILAACLLTFSSPYVLLDASFLFSFFSTFAILVAGAPLSDALRRTVFSRFQKSTRLTISMLSNVVSALVLASCISVFTFPLQLLFYGEFQLLSPLYSVILIPLFSPCLFLGLLHAIVLLLPFSISFVETVSQFAVRTFLFLVSLLSKASPESVSLGAISPAMALFWFSLLLAAMILRRRIRGLLYLQLVFFFIPALCALFRIFRIL